MYYQNPGYNFGYGCYMPQYNCCNTSKGSKNGYALILVLFILLVIIGAARW